MDCSLCPSNGFHSIVLKSFRGKMVIILCIASEISGGQAIFNRRLPQLQHKLIVIVFVSRGSSSICITWNMSIRSVHLVINRHPLLFKGKYSLKHMFARYRAKRPTLWINGIKTHSVQDWALTKSNYNDTLISIFQLQ